MLSRLPKISYCPFQVDKNEQCIVFSGYEEKFYFNPGDTGFKVSC